MLHNLSGYDARLFITTFGKKFNKDNMGYIEEDWEKYIGFNVKINVRVAGVTNKDGKEAHKNIQLKSIVSCRLMYQV